jgi:UDP-glucose 4-epimerase
MSLLVTGSSGFIGSNLADYLSSKKIKFFGLDKVDNKYIKIKNFYKTNLTNKSKLEKIFKKNKFKYIIHLAALPGFVSCHNYPDKAFNDNIIATFNLIELAKKYGTKKILIASSMGVDNFKESPSIYGFTKFFCEQLSHTYVKTKNMNITICKISNVFGPYSLHKSSVVHSFIKNILNKKPLKIHKNGLQERDFIYSLDVCKIFVNNIFKLSKKKEIKINTRRFLRVMDIKKLLDSISMKKNKLNFVTTPSGYDDKVYNKPIIKANKSFINNLKKTFNWYNDTYKK